MFGFNSQLSLLLLLEQPVLDLLILSISALYSLFSIKAPNIIVSLNFINVSDALMQFCIFLSFSAIIAFLVSGHFNLANESAATETVEEAAGNEVFGFIRLMVAGALILFAKKFLVLIYYLGSLLVFINLGGVSLYSFSSSSYIVITIMLSVIVNYIVVKMSILLQKIYFFDNFMPPGSPRNMGLLLVFIEIISFFSRILSLAIRLFANITAGHILLKILSMFSIIFLFAFSIYVFLIIIPNLIVTSLVFLESAIALLQTYVFISLVVLYFATIYGGH